jgi:zinc and cadmium transporter
MSPLTYSLLSAFAIALIAVLTVVVFYIKEKILEKILLGLVSFSAGALLGGAFFHLLPEIFEENGFSINLFIYAFIGFLIFFLIEKILRWRHCHEFGCPTHSHLGYMNLIGDSIHNLIDGIVIISAFSVNSALGLAVTISIALHEIPQEIGDYGVMIYAGIKKTTAVLYNFIAAMVIIVGVFASYFLLNQVNHLNNFLLPFAAGSFIYIAAADLIPEIHKENNWRKSLFSFLMFLLAAALMFFARY